MSNHAPIHSDVLLMKALLELGTAIGFTHFDRWNDNLNRLRTGDLKAFATPALFADLRDIEYEERMGNYQRSIAQLDLHAVAAHRLEDYANPRSGDSLERSSVLSAELYELKKQLDHHYKVVSNVPGRHTYSIASDFTLESEATDIGDDEFLQRTLTYSLVLNWHYC